MSIQILYFIDQLETTDVPSTISKSISKMFYSRIVPKVTSSTQTDGIEISEPEKKRRYYIFKFVLKMLYVF